MAPQERMKAKMQEKAKKKTAEKYTVDQLLEKVISNTLFPPNYYINKISMLV